jgi:hypothetical protein
MFRLSECIIAAPAGTRCVSRQGHPRLHEERQHEEPHIHDQQHVVYYDIAIIEPTIWQNILFCFVNDKNNKYSE